MPMGIRPVMPGTPAKFSNSNLPPSRESSLPPRQVSGPPPPAMTGGYPKHVAQPPLAMSPGSSHPPVSSPPAAAFQPFAPASEFQPHNPNLPVSSMAGPPPMFSPSAVPAGHMQPGVRRSPYVPPDFSNLPSNPASLAGGAAPPPPMGPALIGGYRKTKPM